MDNRLKLHNYLLTLCPNVYFQQPSDMNMKYPAIVYSRSKMEKVRASNKTYILNHAYDVTVIDRNPDCPVVDEILKLDYSEYDRQFCTNGLNHITITLYF